MSEASPAFDPDAKERALHDEASQWDTSNPVAAEPGDIPIIDVAEFFQTGSRDALDTAAQQLRVASEDLGFYQLVGHGVSPSHLNGILAEAKRLHALPDETKATIRMDRPDWPTKGVGHLPVGERKLPRRAQGNLNEAFLIKSDRDIAPEDNQWLPEPLLPGFRAAVLSYSQAIEAVALKLLPVYAAALELDADFFTEAFTHPFWRLRLSHYPPAPGAEPGGAYGIAPHVDTTFFTLLLQDSGGLHIFSHRRDCWIEAPVISGAFVVNSGELLRQWSNDRFLSTRHFANNAATADRYSVPFFFNANADYPMECLPSCHGPGNPAKYPPISYRESQAVAQGE